MHRDDLRDELIKTDEEFRRLAEEHQQYEQRLEQLDQRTVMSQEAEAEAKTIKLHKLALKDRMEAILRARSEERVTA